MATEVKGSTDHRWIVVGSPDGDIPAMVIRAAQVERYWFDVDDDETIVVLVGRKKWLRLDDDLTEQLDAALGIEWHGGARLARALGIDWTAVRHSDEEDSTNA